MTYTPDNPVPPGVHAVYSADGRHWTRRGTRWYSGMEYTWPGDLEASYAPLTRGAAGEGWTEHGIWVGESPEPEEGPPGGARAKCLSLTLCDPCSRDAKVIRGGL
ncbi:hypothetical protein [Streptomyces sp. NPDC059063]|uniref:hypothetical protein n=1 Tax=Streptomyces sp. NPDC059063 TaxID=3346712 RepID=UPI00368D9E01